MKIQYCSDLHLEFPTNNQYLQNNPLVVSGDVLILAGDIALLNSDFLSCPFIDFISEHYREVFWLPGNHEFYYRDIKDFGDVIDIQLKNNVRVVNNLSITVDDVRFIFSTLWSKIPLEKQIRMEQGVSDFQCITYGGRKLNVSDFNTLHHYSLDFLNKSFDNEFSKTVVVTHHAPSQYCNSSIHKNSFLNDAFCVDLTNLINDLGPDFWIYGHSHYNQKSIFLDKTILLTNQLGYIHCNEHKSFRRNAYFSL